MFILVDSKLEDKRLLTSRQRIFPIPKPCETLRNILPQTSCQLSLAVADVRNTVGYATTNECYNE